MRLKLAVTDENIRTTPCDFSWYGQLVYVWVCVSACMCMSVYVFVYVSGHVCGGGRAGFF